MTVLLMKYHLKKKELKSSYSDNKQEIQQTLDDDTLSAHLIMAAAPVPFLGVV
jgi:hypothetical protein